jgi:hypothetical protein
VNDLLAWNEVQDFRLTAPLSIDLGGTSIAAGTWISSHGLVFDPLRPKTLEGTVTFDQPILGVILLTATLVASDWLGVAPTVYNSPPGRGLDLGANDVTSFSGNVLSFSWVSGDPGDNVRVITAGIARAEAAPLARAGADAVPEPAGWATMIAGLLAAGLVLRRRRTGGIVRAIG